MDGYPQLTGILQPHRFHGLVFDGLAFAGSILFATRLPLNGEELPEKTAGWLLSLAILCQILGAIAKTGPLQRRLSQDASAGSMGCSDRLMKILLFWHFILFTVTAGMAFGFLGLVDINNTGSEAGLEIWPAIAMSIAALTAFAVWRAGRRPAKKAQERFALPGIEYGADVLLSLSVSIMTYFFWDVLILGLVDSARGIGFGTRGLVLLFSLSFLFVVFYLPSRYLFLVEDARYPSTWARVWLVMLPLAWRVLIG